MRETLEGRALKFWPQWLEANRNKQGTEEFTANAFAAAFARKVLEEARSKGWLRCTADCLTNSGPWTFGEAPCTCGLKEVMEGMEG